MVTDPYDLDGAVNYEIAMSDFQLMIDAIKAYKGTPNEVYIRKDKVKLPYYVSWDNWKTNLLPRYNAYYDKYKKNPLFIWINKPTTPIVPIVPIKAKPAGLIQVEKGLGFTINTITNWINGLINIKAIYNHYNCMQYKSKGLTIMIQKIKSGGMNCADYCWLTEQIFIWLIQWGKKYAYQINHVWCENSSHIAEEYLGHFYMIGSGEELGNSWVDVDASEAASGGRGIPHIMCTYGDKVIGHTLC